MTLKEAAKKLGKTDRALYHHIERSTGLGRIFTKKEGRLFCYAKDLRRFVK